MKKIPPHLRPMASVAPPNLVEHACTSLVAADFDVANLQTAGGTA